MPARRYPRVVLHPDFKRAIYADPRGQCRIAPMAGYVAATRLSMLLHRRAIPASPVNLERLPKLAEVIGYSGPIFKGDAR